MTIAKDISTNALTDTTHSDRLSTESYQIAQAAIIAADDRKGEDIVLLSIGDVSSLADYFVIVSGLSKTQVRAIANAVEEAIETKLGRKPRNIAGIQESTWILLDYGDVIVHAMMQKEREYYGLEAFWGHAPKLEVVIPAA